MGIHEFDSIDNGRMELIVLKIVDRKFTSDILVPARCIHIDSRQPQTHGYTKIAQMIDFQVPAGTETGVQSKRTDVWPGYNVSPSGYVVNPRRMTRLSIESEKIIVSTQPNIKDRK